MMVLKILITSPRLISLSENSIKRAIIYPSLPPLSSWVNPPKPWAFKLPPQNSPPTAHANNAAHPEPRLSLHSTRHTGLGPPFRFANAIPIALTLTLSYSFLHSDLNSNIVSSVRWSLTLQSNQSSLCLSNTPFVSFLALVTVLNREFVVHFLSVCPPTGT